MPALDRPNPPPLVSPSFLVLVKVGLLGSSFFSSSLVASTLPKAALEIKPPSSLLGYPLVKPASSLTTGCLMAALAQPPVPSSSPSSSTMPFSRFSAAILASFSLLLYSASCTFLRFSTFLSSNLASSRIFFLSSSPFLRTNSFIFCSCSTFLSRIMFSLKALNTGNAFSKDYFIFNSFSCLS